MIDTVRADSTTFASSFLKKIVYPILGLVNYNYQMRKKTFSVWQYLIPLSRYFGFWRYLLKYGLKYNLKIDTLERTCVYCHMLFQITEIFNVLSTQNDFIFKHAFFHIPSDMQLPSNYLGSRLYNIRIPLILKLLLGLHPVDSRFSLCFCVVLFGVTNVKKCAIFTITLCKTVWHVVCLILRVLLLPKLCFSCC